MLAHTASAQPPAGYYNTAFGLNGTALRSSLHSIIAAGALNIGYTNLWSVYPHTDKKADGKVWDIYSDKPGATPSYEYTFVTDQCGSYSAEGDCYNREHTWPESYFGSTEPERSDINMVFPTDGWVNNKRANYPYGEVSSATYTSSNGSHLGNNTYPGSGGGNCFEPIDSFKGDLARNYFYASTRYYTEDGGWNNWEMANGADLKSWTINMLLEWHHNDPVSQKEINRNDSVYTLQHNRNPFIDYPQFADCIWGTGDCSSMSVAGIPAPHILIYPQPAKNTVHLVLPGSSHSLIVINEFGSIISASAIINSSIDLDIRGWAAGLYVIRVTTGNSIITQKFVVE